MWLIAYLPFALQIRLGQTLGLLSFHFARSRRHICEVNLRMCFPDLSDKEHAALVRKTFDSNGIGMIEICMCWFRDPEVYRNRVKVFGLENIEAALAKGKGVLMIGAHFSTLDFGGTLISLFVNIDVTYRGNDNPLFNEVMIRGRQRLYGNVIDRQDVRSSMRSLKSGHILWYAPDQDYGAKYSIFVPFFGNEAATITATSRYANFNNSEVLMCRHYRNEDNSGYHLHFDKVIDDYPSGDDSKDALRMNQLVEEAILVQPDQYMWLHRRFKTQAAGKSARPY